jgi:hypothetical protein
VWIDTRGGCITLVTPVPLPLWLSVNAQIRPAFKVWPASRDERPVGMWKALWKSTLERRLALPPNLQRSSQRPSSGDCEGLSAPCCRSPDTPSDRWTHSACATSPRFRADVRATRTCARNRRVNPSTPRSSSRRPRTSRATVDAPEQGAWFTSGPPLVKRTGTRLDLPEVPESR